MALQLSLVFWSALASSASSVRAPASGTSTDEDWGHRRPVEAHLSYTPPSSTPTHGLASLHCLNVNAFTQVICVKYLNSPFSFRYLAEPEEMFLLVPWILLSQVSTSSNSPFEVDLSTSPSSDTLETLQQVARVSLQPRGTGCLTKLYTILQSRNVNQILKSRISFFPQ